MLALYAVDRGSIPDRVMPTTCKMIHAISLLSIKHFGKEHGSETTVLPDGQPPTVSFAVLAQLCGPKADETELGAASFTKMVREGALTLTPGTLIRLSISSLVFKAFYRFQKRNRTECCRQKHT